MAWKLRKDKLKAGAPESETPTDAVVGRETPTAAPEQAPVFDLSGSAFQTEPVETPEEEPEIPRFIDDDQPVALAPQPMPVEERDVIDLEPLPATGPASEAAFQAEPLPEFDPTVAPAFASEPNEIGIAPSVFSPESGRVDPQMTQLEPETATPGRRELTPEREAIASGLVTMETETGLPRVAPFILDTPPTSTVPEPPRMRSVVIRIGKLSATHFLTKAVTTIGRPDSVVQNYPDIEIELDDGISRRHAEIRQDGTEYALADVGSTNGTVLNGEALTAHQPVVLRPGDRVRLGERTELLFE